MGSSPVFTLRSVSESAEIQTLGSADRELAAEALPEPPLQGEIVQAASAGALLRSLAPATQTVAVAASGFIAGAAIAGLASRRRRRRATRALPRPRRRGGETPGAELLQIVGTRSLLVDVHLLGLPAADR